MSAQGLDRLYGIIGKELTRVRRFVLGLGRSNDAFGHGITELSFEDRKLVVQPGLNEDFLVISEGSFDPSGLNTEYWSEVDLTAEQGWKPRGKLVHVDVFSDGIEDVALVFCFQGGDEFSIVLCDGDVAIGRRLERFATDPNQVHPSFRERVALGGTP